MVTLHFTNDCHIIIRYIDHALLDVKENMIHPSPLLMGPVVMFIVGAFGRDLGSA